LPASFVIIGASTLTVTMAGVSKATTRTFDRRQPLPPLFAARYIDGGTGAYATNLTVWREGFGSESNELNRARLLPACGALVGCVPAVTMVHAPAVPETCAVDPPVMLRIRSRRAWFSGVFSVGGGW
jgi:hypothetical protein